MPIWLSAILRRSIEFLTEEDTVLREIILDAGMRVRQENGTSNCIVVSHELIEMRVTFKKMSEHVDLIDMYVTFHNKDMGRLEPLPFRISYESLATYAAAAQDMVSIARRLDEMLQDDGMYLIIITNKSR
tara:strand:- start:82330 stop:82719 length:390 start_codon:yes stop_codon:yes gene_type:complete